MECVSDEDQEGREETLFQLGYSSTATRPLGVAGLIQLLNTARDRNRSLDITGCLMHREDSFFQVIEGRKSVVLALFEMVRKDVRHKRVEVLYQSPVEKREFPDWMMGFVDLDGIDVSLLPGFSNFMSESTEPRQVLEELTRTRRMMLLFRAIS